jgi:hypothetical protein
MDLFRAKSPWVWLALAMFALGLTLGCGSETPPDRDAASAADDPDQDNNDDDDDDDETPGGVRLMVAGVGGVLLYKNGEVSFVADAPELRVDRLIPEGGGSFLSVGEVVDEGESAVWRIDSASESFEEIYVPAETSEPTLVGGVSDGGRLWLVGADDTTGTGLLLRLENGVWDRIDLQPEAPSAHWWLTAAAVYEGSLLLVGWDEDNLHELYFIMDAGQDVPRPLSDRLREDRTFYPTKMFVTGGERGVWIIGRYWSLSMEPVAYWNGNDWTLAGSCALGSHLNWWIDQAHGFPTLVGAGCIDGSGGVDSFERPASCNESLPIIVEYDRSRENVDGLGNVSYWHERPVAMPDAVRVVHVKETSRGVFYLYFDTDGWLNLFHENSGTRTRLSNDITEVSTAVYL